MDEEKSKFSFTCSFCNSLNQLDFNTIRNNYTNIEEKILNIINIEEKINGILQINLMKLKTQ